MFMCEVKDVVYVNVFAHAVFPLKLIPPIPICKWGAPPSEDEPLTTPYLQGPPWLAAIPISSLFPALHFQVLSCPVLGSGYWIQGPHSVLQSGTVDKLLPTCPQGGDRWA